MRAALLALLSGLLILAACADLRFLDDAISEAAQSAPPPELSPLSEIPVVLSDTEAGTDPTEALLGRAEALRNRAAQAD